MRLSISCALISLSFVHGFAPKLTSQSQSSAIAPSQTRLLSTLAPQTPKEQVDDDGLEEKGALSMQIDELAELLGGKGRAQIVWDCYSIVSQK